MLLKIAMTGLIPTQHVRCMSRVPRACMPEEGRTGVEVVQDASGTDVDGSALQVGQVVRHLRLQRPVSAYSVFCVSCFPAERGGRA